MSSFSRLFFVPLLLLLLLVRTTNAQTHQNCTFDKIFHFGDEISDTGNWLRQIESTPWAGPYANPPYNKTGRASNGLLMIDYLAKSVGLPHLLPPYMDTSADFSRGVNFATAGSTALPPQQLLDKYEIGSPSNMDLNLQFDWMWAHFNLIGGNIRADQNNLFVVGPIGGNDYLNGIRQGKQMDEVINMIPDVVDAIMTAVRKTVLIYGARKVVVPGLLPIGCLPIYKAILQTDSLDENNCLKVLNDLAKGHNDKLLEATVKLGFELEIGGIVYGDHYDAYQDALQSAKDEGFEVEKSCCGIGGKYRFDVDRRCGCTRLPRPGKIFELGWVEFE